MTSTTTATDQHTWTEAQLNFLRQADRDGLRGQLLYGAFRRRFRRHAGDLTDQAIRARFHALRYRD
jgi:hypothetical protein